MTLISGRNKFYCVVSGTFRNAANLTKCPGDGGEPLASVGRGYFQIGAMRYPVTESAGILLDHENLFGLHSCRESVLDRGGQENSKCSPIPGSRSAHKPLAQRRCLGGRPERASSENICARYELARPVRLVPRPGAGPLFRPGF